MTLNSMLRDVSMARTARRAAALALGLCALGGCAAGQEPADEAVEEGLAPITSLQLSNGAEVHFYEPEEGRVLAFTTGELDESMERLPPVALYEALSREAAPPALIAAQDRMDAARLAGGARRAAIAPDVDVVEEATPAPAPARRPSAGEELGTAAQALTASDFVASYCSASSVDFDYCWTDSSVGRTVTVNGTKWYHAHVDSTSGTVQMAVYYRNMWGNDVLVFFRTVTSTGGVFSYETENNDTYTVVVSQVDPGNTYHLSVHGDQ
ncbi:hypothetical protein WMF39_25010 [Sorangium sp. So ce1504]|uniref:hypothetical protein n=1 Tax=Sorangium sp. So ce1504 TaxID=3133337 RepID=UPI003F613823